MLILTSSCLAGFLRQWHVQARARDSVEKASGDSQVLAWIAKQPRVLPGSIAVATCDISRLFAAPSVRWVAIAVVVEQPHAQWRHHLRWERILGFQVLKCFRSWRDQRPEDTLANVVRFVRFIPATTATLSSMEPFVCKTEKIHRDVGAVRTLTFQVGDYRWPDGREYRGTSDPKFAKLHLIRREFFEMVFFVRMPMIYWSWTIMFFFFFLICWFLPLHQNVCHTSEFHQENISVTKVERRLYARLWHVPILFSWRWQGAKSLPKVCRLMFSDCIFHWILWHKWHFCQRFMGFSMNGKFASGAVEQDEAKNEDEWLRSILLCYFYSVVNEKQSRLLLCSIPLRPIQSRKTNSCGVVSLWRGQKSLSAGIWCPMRLVHSAWVVWY